MANFKCIANSLVPITFVRRTVVTSYANRLCVFYSYRHGLLEIMALAEEPEVLHPIPTRNMTKYVKSTIKTNYQLSTSRDDLLAASSGQFIATLTKSNEWRIPQLHNRHIYIVSFSFEDEVQLRWTIVYKTFHCSTIGLCNNVNRPGSRLIMQRNKQVEIYCIPHYLISIGYYLAAPIV